MRRAQMRWDEDEVWSLKCAVSSATFGTQCVAWCCITTWMCAGHVHWQQQRSRFAKSMHAQAWVVQGACKFYRYLKWKMIRKLQKPEIWTCFCLSLVGLAEHERRPQMAQLWLTTVPLPTETLLGLEISADSAPNLATWLRCTSYWLWALCCKEPLCKSSDWDKVNASTMVPLQKPEKGVLGANRKLNNIEPINKHPTMKGTSSHAASS